MEVQSHGEMGDMKPETQSPVREKIERRANPLNCIMNRSDKKCLACCNVEFELVIFVKVCIHIAVHVLS